MHTFISPTKVVIGNLCTKDLLKDYNRIFIVSDAFLVSHGQVDLIKSYLNPQSTSFVFSDVLPDPDTDTVSAGLDQLLEFKPDLVIALGGGSPIDTAKALCYFAKNKFGMKDLGFVAIPTTSGTGSEVTKYAVITNSQTHIKSPILSDDMLPDMAILDPNLTLSVPPGVTADTGMDVLTHSLEAYASVRANDFSDACAQKAIQLVYKHLKKAYTTPNDIEARQGMHNASCLAGIAFSNVGLGLCHAMAHALGSKFKIPHGRANAVLLPYIMGYNAGCGKKPMPVMHRYVEIGMMLDLGNGAPLQTARNLIRNLQSLIKSLGIATTIEALGISKTAFEATIDELSELALSDGCLVDNPTTANLEDIKQVYRNAFSGKPY